MGKISEDKILVQRPSSPRPELMNRTEFEAIWDGRVVLMARRASLSDLSRRFDITWFLGAVHKYRHLLTEVLVASFFLQLFSLVSPLFFQNRRPSGIFSSAVRLVRNRGTTTSAHSSPRRRA